MKMVMLFFLMFFSFAVSAQDYHVWSEFLPLKEVEGALPMLREKKVTLHLAMNQNDFLNQEKLYQFMQTLRQAEKQGVAVYLWPLLSLEAGYWPNSSNIGPFSDYVYKLTGFLKGRQIKFEGISIDLEPPPEMQKKMAQYLKKFQFKQLIQYLNGFCGNGELNANFHRQLTGMISSLEAMGVRTHIVTTPLVLEDFRRGQSKIQNIFGIPLNTLASTYSFMAYSTIYESFMGRLSSDLVYDYAVLAKKNFASKNVALDLGVIGEVEFPVPVHGYKKIKKLKKDIQAARAAGIDQVHLYSLDGILTTSDPSSWFAPQKAKVPPKSLKWSFYKKLQNNLYEKLCP